MPRYKYTATSLSGESLSGEYSAPDQNSVIGMLRGSGFYPLSVQKVADDVVRVTSKRVKIKPLSGLCQQMSTMLKSGVPITKTLEILKEQTDDKTLCEILGDVFVRVQRGESLYNSFKPYESSFPVIFLNMIEAGEQSGMLDVCMGRAGVTFSRTAKLGGRVKAAMTYPVILLMLMIGIVILLMAFVIPSFVTMFEQSEAQLPALTRLLVFLSDIVVGYWFVVLPVIMLGALSFAVWISSDSGRLSFDSFKLRAPVVSGLLIKVYAARYTRTLSSLTAAGVSLPTALAVTARSVGNKHIELELYKAAEEVSRGVELSVLLERMSCMPRMVVHLTRLGEESGTMDELLLQAADFYDEEAESALQALTAMMEPLMIIIMAAVLLPVIMAIILPVFDMYSFIA